MSKERLENVIGLSCEAEELLLRLLYHMSPHISAKSPHYELGLAMSLWAFKKVPMDIPKYIKMCDEELPDDYAKRMGIIPHTRKRKLMRKTTPTTPNSVESHQIKVTPKDSIL